MQAVPTVRSDITARWQEWVDLVARVLQSARVWVEVEGYVLVTAGEADSHAPPVRLELTWPDGTPYGCLCCQAPALEPAHLDLLAHIHNLIATDMRDLYDSPLVLPGAIISAMSANICIVNPRGDIVAVNQAWQDFAVENGAHAAAVRGNYLAVCDEASGPYADEAPHFAAAIREVLAGQRDSFEMEYACHAPDQRRWFVGRVTALAIGGRRWALVAHEDITARVLLDEKLDESKLRLRSLIEHTTDAIFCYEFDEPIPIDLPREEQVRRMYDCWLVECNDVCARTYGDYQPMDVVGRPLTELFGTRPNSLDKLFGALIDNDYHVIDSLGVEHLPDGSTRYYLNNAVGVIEDGQLLRVWGSFRDVTEREESNQLLARQARFHALIATIARLLLGWERPDDDEPILEVLRLLTEFGEIDRCSIAVVANEGQDAFINYSYAVPGRERWPRGIHSSRYFQWYTNLVMEGQIVNFADMLAELPPEAAPERAYCEHSGLRASLCVPMLAGEQVVGSIICGIFDRPQRWSPHWVDQLRTIAELIGTALLRVQAAAALRQRHAEVGAMLQVAQAVSTSLDLDTVLDALLEHLEAAVPYSSASIALLEEDRLQFITGRGYPPDIDWQQLVPISDADYWGLELLNKRQLVIIDDVRHDERWIPVPGLHYMRSWMGVPLVLSEKGIGLLYLDHRQPGFYNQDHARLALAVAQQAAVAIDHARLYADLEQRVADRTIALQKETEQSEAILQNISDAIVLTDAHSQVLYVNPAWQHLTGYTQDEALGRTPCAVLGISREATQELGPTTRQGQTWSRVVSAQREDGTPFDCDLTVAPVLDEADELAQLVGVMRDVTEARQLAAMRERFIADAAHDLGNPVATLQMQLSLIKMDPDRQDEYLGLIEHQVGRLESLVRNLLILSRLDRGKLAPRFGALNLNTVVRRVLAGQRFKALQKQIQLNFEPSELPPLEGDAEQLERVVVNLVSNAVHYTPEGGQVHVQTNVEGRWAVLAVRDNGIGIQAEDLPHIFERFYRADDVRATMEGTGLGLSIVKEIVTLHHGSISVESAAGAGSTFMVRLPFAPE